MARILTPRQAALKLQKDPRTIYRWARRGQLPGARKIGGRWHVLEEAIIAHLTGKPLDESDKR
jgi:predicted site-specific integrase-resolvase